MPRKKIAFVALVFSISTASAAKKPVTIDAVLHSEEGTRSARANITWAANGSQFVLEREGMLSVYDLPSGKSRDIIALTKLQNAAEKTAHPDVVFDWTNRRVEENDIQWF